MLSPIRYRCSHCRGLTSRARAIPRLIAMLAPVSAGTRVAGTLVAEQSLTTFLLFVYDPDSHS